MAPPSPHPPDPPPSSPLAPSLAGERVLLCATGSVAAIRVPALAAALTAAGAALRVAATAPALHFLTRESPLPRNIPLLTDASEWSAWSALGDPVVHVEVAKWATVLLLAPASANSLAKVAAGGADGVVTCAVLAWPGREGTVAVVAPAMNTAMWGAAAVRANVATLVARGWWLVPPVAKRLACGDVGVGGMASPAAIVAAVGDALATARVRGGGGSGKAPGGGAAHTPAPAIPELPLPPVPAGGKPSSPVGSGASIAVAASTAAIPLDDVPAATVTNPPADLLSGGAPSLLESLPPHPPGLSAATAARVATTAAAGVAAAAAGVDAAALPASRVVWVVEGDRTGGGAAVACWLAAALSPEGRAVGGSPLPLVALDARAGSATIAGAAATASALVAAAGVAPRGGGAAVLLHVGGVGVGDGATNASGPPAELVGLVGAPRVVTLVAAATPPPPLPLDSNGGEESSGGVSSWPPPDLVLHLCPPASPSLQAARLLRDAAAALAAAGLLGEGGGGVVGQPPTVERGAASDRGDGGDRSFSGGASTHSDCVGEVGDEMGSPVAPRAAAALAAAVAATSGWSAAALRRLPLAALATVAAPLPNAAAYWEAAAAAAAEINAEGGEELREGRSPPLPAKRSREE